MEGRPLCHTLVRSCRWSHPWTLCLSLSLSQQSAVPFLISTTPFLFHSLSCDQRKGEGLRSDDGDGDGGLSFLLGLAFFSVVMVVMISLVSLGFGINPQVSWDMRMMLIMKGEEDQTIEEGLDLW